MLQMIGLILLITVLNILMSPLAKKGQLFCGLVGFSGTGEFDMLKVKFLMYWNSIERGTDATGIYSPVNGIIKDNTKAETFINDWRYGGKVVLDNVLIAHVRAKTFGGNTVANAHPFEFGNIVGAHNGTLKNHLTIAYEYGMDVTKIDVDSQVLVQGLYMDSSSANPFKVLSQYEGAAALLFFNKEENALYACHDKERPLYHGWAEDNQMYISSIKEPLEAIGCKGIVAFPVNVVHKIVDGQIVERTPYTTYVPKTVEAVSKVALVADIIWSNYKGNRFASFADGIRGVIASLARAHMMDGYWLRVDNTSCTKGTPFTYGNWYFCTGSNDATLSGQDTVELMAYDGTKHSISVGGVDTCNFIPVTGSYVKTTCNIVDAKDNTIKLIPAGTVCKVAEYHYLDTAIDILRPSDGKKYNITIDCVRNLGATEMTTHLNHLMEEEKKRIALLQEEAKKEVKKAPTCEIEEAVFTEEDSSQPTQLLLPLPVVGAETELSEKIKKSIETISDDEEEEEENTGWIQVELLTNYVDSVRANLRELDVALRNHDEEEMAEVLDTLHDEANDISMDIMSNTF